MGRSMWCWELEVPVWLPLWSHWNIHQSHWPKVRLGKELFGVWVLWPQFEVSTVRLVERFLSSYFLLPLLFIFSHINVAICLFRIVFPKKWSIKMDLLHLLSHALDSLNRLCNAYSSVIHFFEVNNQNSI